MPYATAATAQSLLDEMRALRMEQWQMARDFVRGAWAFVLPLDIFHCLSRV